MNDILTLIVFGIFVCEIVGNRLKWRIASE